jgi:hypothetical protein
MWTEVLRSFSAVEQVLRRFEMGFDGSLAVEHSLRVRSIASGWGVMTFFLREELAED